MGPGPITTYPIFNTPERPRGLGQAQRLGRLQHRLQPLRRRRPGRHRRDGEGAQHARESPTPASFRSSAARDRPTIVDVKGVKVGFVAYTDATNGLPLRPPVVGERLRGGRSEGRGQGDHRATPARRAPAGADAVIVRSTGATSTPRGPNNSQIAVAKKLTDAKV